MRPLLWHCHSKREYLPWCLCCGWNSTGRPVRVKKRPGSFQELLSRRLLFLLIGDASSRAAASGDPVVQPSRVHSCPLPQDHIPGACPAIT